MQADLFHRKGGKQAIVATDGNLKIMKFLALPSGLIINVEQIGYIQGSGVYSNQKPETGTLLVTFPAMAGGQGGGAMRLELHGDDIAVFLAALNLIGVNTDATLKAVTEKTQ
jgi:hypothetical protein